MTEITKIFDPCRAAPANRATPRPFTAVMHHDWADVIMLHFAVTPEALRPHLPFTLDTFGGWAWVSLVAFHLENFDLAFAPRLTHTLLRPISNHRFLNLRTYVRHDGEPGIYFLREWLDNRLAVALGPRFYSLPYHYGQLQPGRAIAPEGELAYTIAPTDAHHRPAAPGSLDHFLLERYAAFNHHRGRTRAFRIRHQPWPQRRVTAAITNDALLRAVAPWYSHAHYTCAHHSPGLLRVEISRPYRVQPPTQGAPR